ncbi:ATP-NAD kinase family protein [Halocatena halophila]|uniref:ATP-NAD kinase family protein n=1 Tax=Halocatena halophila TaxID=2814576 RepID=UPI002ED24EC0
MTQIGVVVNPIAGMGGRVGLKGTDGMVERARELGGEPRAPTRARVALESFAQHADSPTFLTAAGSMGASAIDDAIGRPTETTIVHEPTTPTTAADTRATVRAFLAHDVDLVLFVGGDGTAVDVAETITEHDTTVPVLGVPAGVKIYSSVFAVTPRDAGRIGATFERTERREVNDIDEAAYREGTVQSTLKAIVNVPVSDAIQASKQLSGGSLEGLAGGFVDDVRPGTTYLFGPGGTVGTIEDALDIDGAPLGVDLWRATDERDGELLVRDGTESELRRSLGERNVIVVSPIGGQGFVFGRGNQQFSPAVIRDCTLEIVASSEKLDSLSALRVDTGDTALDAALSGWQKVRVGRFERRLCKIV